MFFDILVAFAWQHAEEETSNYLQPNGKMLFRYLNEDAESHQAVVSMHTRLITSEDKWQWWWQLVLFNIYKELHLVWLPYTQTLGFSKTSKDFNGRPESVISKFTLHNPLQLLNWVRYLWLDSILIGLLHLWIIVTTLSCVSDGQRWNQTDFHWSISLNFNPRLLKQRVLHTSPKKKEQMNAGHPQVSHVH